MTTKLLPIALTAALMLAAPARAQEEVDPGEGYEEPAPKSKPAETGPEPVCPMTDEKVEEAVKAFSRMMPAFTDKRCANCHGGINPFTENGGHAGGKINLDFYVRQWTRDRSALVAAFRESTGAAPTKDQIERAETALRTIKSAEGEALSASTIAEILSAGNIEQLISANACAECHKHAPVRWQTAKSRFAGLDQKELCENFQKHRDVTTPAEFVEHISRDPLGFIPVAFAGTRALTPLGQAILKEQTGRAYAPEPVKGIDQIGLNRAAFDWGTALGGKYKKPPSCGCEKKTYDLDLKIRFDVDYAGAGGVGTVRLKQDFALPMKFVEEGKFTAKGTTSLVQTIDVEGSGGECHIEQPGDEDWALKGSIDPDTNEMTIAGTVTTRMKPTVMVCHVGGRTVRQPVPGPTDAQDLKKYDFKMPALVGERKDFRFPHPYGALVVDMAVLER